MKIYDYYENKKHGTGEFPLQYYYVDKNYFQYIMPLHWHNEFEIIHILSGKFKLFVQNVEYSLNQGDIAFVNCGFLHRGEPDNCIYEVLVFDIKMLFRSHKDKISEILFPLVSGEKIVSTLLNQDESKLYADLISFFNLFHFKPKYYELSAFSLIYNIFFSLFSSNKIETGTEKRRRKKINEIENILKWIDEHYTEKIDLNDLSAVCGLNKKYLCHSFKEITGTTPINYINKIRIENACRELRSTHKTMTEIAVEIGFNDPSYFARIFKKEKGISPKFYLKINRSSL